MKINAKMFGEEGKRIAIPMWAFRMKESHMNDMATMMQKYGIQELQLTVVTTNFLPSVSISMSTFLDDVIPTVIKNEQIEIARALMILMSRWGIQVIRIEPTPEELDKIKTYWTYVETGSATPEDVPVKGGMPKPTDPQHIPVKLKIQPGLQAQLPGGLGKIIGARR